MNEKRIKILNQIYSKEYNLFVRFKKIFSFYLSKKKTLIINKAKLKAMKALHLDYSDLNFE
jgi:hypothetical protein